MSTKRCSKCGETHPIECFTKDKKRADGLDPWCRACKQRQNANSYAGAKESAMRRALEWRRANPERRNAIVNRYRANHREREIERFARSRADLADAYVRGRLGLVKDECPEDLLKAKKLQLAIKRLIKEKTE